MALKKKIQQRKSKSSSLSSDSQICNLSPKVATVDSSLYMGSIGEKNYMYILSKILHKWFHTVLHFIFFHKIVYLGDLSIF